MQTEPMSETAQSMMLDVPAYMRGLGETAREAARLLGRAETAAKNAALLAIADAIVAEREGLAAQNRKDLEAG
jgi:glutamate-5-semialdehyde dehydrogenase